MVAVATTTAKRVLADLVRIGDQVTSCCVARPQRSGALCRRDATSTGAHHEFPVSTAGTPMAFGVRRWRASLDCEMIVWAYRAPAAEAIV